MMRSLSSVGLGLSVVFCCLLLALLLEIYYLLWWKRRWVRRETILEEDYSSPATDLYMLCWKRPRASSSTLTLSLQQHQQQQGFKSFDETNTDFIMAPRFLFTIKEETREDLESEDGKSRGRSLSDLLKNMVETPYLTPLSSPPFLTPPLTPTPTLGLSSTSSQHNHKQPFNENLSDAEFNKMRASPPPMFKFLRDAEEKLERKNMAIEDEGDGSFIRIIVPENREAESRQNTSLT